MSDRELRRARRLSRWGLIFAAVCELAVIALWIWPPAGERQTVPPIGAFVALPLVVGAWFVVRWAERRDGDR